MKIIHEYAILFICVTYKKTKQNVYGWNVLMKMIVMTIVMMISLRINSFRFFFSDEGVGWGGVESAHTISWKWSWYEMIVAVEFVAIENTIFTDWYRGGERFGYFENFPSRKYHFIISGWIFFFLGGALIPPFFTSLSRCFFFFF